VAGCLHRQSVRLALSPFLPTQSDRAAEIYWFSVRLPRPPRLQNRLGNYCRRGSLVELALIGATAYLLDRGAFERLSLDDDLAWMLVIGQVLASGMDACSDELLNLFPWRFCAAVRGDDGL
jgi:hypothetical protein